jgi:hypothetical protein
MSEREKLQRKLEGITMKEPPYGEDVLGERAPAAKKGQTICEHGNPNPLLCKLCAADTIYKTMLLWRRRCERYQTVFEQLDKSALPEEERRWLEKELAAIKKSK